MQHALADYFEMFEQRAEAVDRRMGTTTRRARKRLSLQAGWRAMRTSSSEVSDASLSRAAEAWVSAAGWSAEASSTAALAC